MRECFLSVMLIYGLGLLDHELLYYVHGTEVLAIWKSYYDFLFFSDNNNRVKLIADVSIPGSDYINASYVSVSYYFHR